MIKILELIKSNPQITKNEIAEKIQKSARTVQRLINSNPKIKYVGSSKGGHWEIEE